MNLHPVLRIVLSILVALLFLGLFALILGVALIWWLYRWVMNKLTGRPMPLMGLRRWQEGPSARAWAGFGRRLAHILARMVSGRPGATRATRATRGDDGDVVDVQAREVLPSDRQLR